MKASEVICSMELQVPGFDQESWEALPLDKVAFANKLREELSLSADGKKSASDIRIALRSFISASIVQTTPDKEGRLRDLLSQEWLDLVIKTNVGLARGYINRLSGMTPVAFKVFPAQELKLVLHTDEPVPDWQKRWQAAGGRLFGAGRMIALKTDPVWSAISAFGLPYPPFDWGSGMDVRDIGRKEAVELGVATIDEVKAIAAKLCKGCR